MDQREKAVQMITDLIKEYGIKEEDCKDQSGKDVWYFVQGSANFQIELFLHDKGNEKVQAIEIAAIIMKLPEEEAKKNALYQRILEMNSTSCGVWFGVRNNLLMLLSNREVEGLDMVELRHSFDDIRLYADYFDDVFKQEFGG